MPQNLASNRFAAISITLISAVGALVGIIGGFYATFKLVTLIGA